MIEGMIDFSFLCWSRFGKELIGCFFTVLKNFLSSFNSICFCSLGLVDSSFVNCLIFFSIVFSSCCCCFFLDEEYEIILPLINAFSASHNSDGGVSGDSFIFK